MDEADQLPAGDQRRLPCEDRVEQRDVRLRRIGELRVVSRPRVVRKRPHGFLVVVCRCPLHGADADMARGNARQHGAVEHRLAIDRLARLHHGQAPGGRNAERVHRLADDVFPQHRPERGAPVTPAGEPRLPCPFQLNVHAIAGWRDLLAKQDRTAIAEGGEVAELVAGVRLRDRSPAFGQRHCPRKSRRLRDRSSASGSSPSIVASGRLNAARRGSRTGSRCRMRVEELRQLRVGVLEVPACHVTIIAARALERVPRAHYGRAAAVLDARRHTSTTSSTPAVLMKPLTSVSRFWNRMAKHERTSRGHKHDVLLGHAVPEAADMGERFHQHRRRRRGRRRRAGARRGRRLP